MTLKRDLHFIIAPKHTLNEYLEDYIRQTGEDEAIVLKEKVIWRKDFSATTLDNHTAQVKLLFLAEIHTQALDVPDDQHSYRDLLLELLGSVPYTVETFDRWWTLEAILENFYHFEDFEEDAERTSLTHLADDRPEISQWLKVLLADREALRQSE